MTLAALCLLVGGGLIGHSLIYLARASRNRGMGELRVWLGLAGLLLLLAGCWLQGRG